MVEPQRDTKDQGTAKPSMDHQYGVKAKPMGKEKKHEEQPKRAKAMKKWEVNSIPYDPIYYYPPFP